MPLAIAGEAYCVSLSRLMPVRWGAPQYGLGLSVIHLDCQHMLNPANQIVLARVGPV